MKRTLMLGFFILSFFLSGFANAKEQTGAKARIIAKAEISYQDHTVTIKNLQKTLINLADAELTFYYNGKVFDVRGLNSLKVQSKVSFKESPNSPNNAGHLYTIRLSNLNQPILKPGQAISLQLNTDEKASAPTGFKLLLEALGPAAVKVTVLPANWTQTIQICNNTPNSIQLKNVRFTFNFGQAISSFWGSPYLDWKVASHQGNTYVLSGGTPWSSPLPSDPNCVNPMTIQFSSTPSTPVPSGPFIFEAEGVAPVGAGSIDVSLGQAPAASLPDPTITVTGASNTVQKTVAWGQSWQLTNLVPGTYQITAQSVDNGNQFYTAAAKSVLVETNKTTGAQITYQSVPSGNVTVTLVNAPSNPSVTFSGKNYSFVKVLQPGMVLSLPQDTYTVSTSLAGYKVTTTPNPLVVPTNANLQISYTKSQAIPLFVGYFQSWSSKWASDPAKTEIANMAPYVNVINLSFIMPDAKYVKGSLNYASTGLQFNYENGTVLKQAVALLHQRNPNTKVIIAVGGASYTNWAGFNAQAVADFVKDFGLDGVDIDYEPLNAGCSKGSDGLIHCQTDAQFQSVIQKMRAALPRPYLLTTATWSVAAFGEGQWSNAQPLSDYTGMVLPLFRSAAAKDLDIVNVMSYDASNAFSPTQALAAYSNYFSGQITMGVEVPPEAWGGHVYSMSEVNSLTQAVIAASASRTTPPGMMIWSLQKQPNGTPSTSNPSAQMMATSICNLLGLPNCNDPIFKTVN